MAGCLREALAWLFVPGALTLVCSQEVDHVCSVLRAPVRHVRAEECLYVIDI